MTCGKATLMLDIVQVPHSAAAIPIGSHDNDIWWVYQCHQVNCRFQQNGVLCQSSGQMEVTLCVMVGGVSLIALPTM